MEFRREALEKLGDDTYWISGADMIVRTRDLGREDFLDWVRIWLRKVDPGFGTMNSGSFEDFSSTSRDAKLIERIFLEYPDASAGI